VLSVDTEPPRKLVKREIHSTPSDADESDALDTPTPAPKREIANIPLSSLVIDATTKSESHLGKNTPKTIVDDMLEPEAHPPRVMRITSPSQAFVSSSEFARTTKAEALAGPHVGSDGLTKKQRQNQKKKERQREARARDEADRKLQLRAHQDALEAIRLNSQIRAAERKAAQQSNDVWGKQTGSLTGMDESVYTIRNLSEENLTTFGHPSDTAGSEEGWQEVTSKAAKKVLSQKASREKVVGGTDGSEEFSSLGESEDASVLKAASPYASGNSFANLDS